MEELKNILGKGRSKKGIFEGELSDGELEIGQVASQIRNILSADEIVAEIMYDFNKSLIKFNSL